MQVRWVAWTFAGSNGSPPRCRGMMWSIDVDHRCGHLRSGYRGLPHLAQWLDSALTCAFRRSNGLPPLPLRSAILVPTFDWRVSGCRIGVLSGPVRLSEGRNPRYGTHTRSPVCGCRNEGVSNRCSGLPEVSAHACCWADSTVSGYCRDECTVVAGSHTRDGEPCATCGVFLTGRVGGVCDTDTVIVEGKAVHGCVTPTDCEPVTVRADAHPCWCVRGYGCRFCGRFGFCGGRFRGSSVGLPCSGLTVAGAGCRTVRCRRCGSGWACGCEGIF